MRESAFRICAADPHCLEVAVGCMRLEKKKLKDPDKTRIYFAVCFIQINDKTLIRGQNKAYRAVMKSAEEGHPKYLRHLGVWGRRKGRAPLLKALDDPDANVSSAAFDGLLLLDEDNMRKKLAAMKDTSRTQILTGHYGRALEPWRPLAYVTYDARIKQLIAKLEGEADTAARDEFRKAFALEEEAKKRARLEDLLKRCEGLRISASIRDALEA